MQFQFILILAYLTSAPASAGVQSIRFGLVDTRPSGFACATFQGPQLDSGQRLYILAFEPPHWVRGEVVGTHSDACNEEAFLEGIAYNVRLDNVDGLEPEMGVGVIATEGAPAIESGEPLFTHPAAEKSISFLKCFSSEGIHFLAWQGRKQLWHVYYYLGYDVVPTCLEKDLEEN